MKEFEDTPQLLSYISWNLKRIADEFERYNDAQERGTPPKQNKEIDNNRLREFINKLDQGDTNGKIS